MTNLNSLGASNSVAGNAGSSDSIINLLDQARAQESAYTHQDGNDGTMDNSFFIANPDSSSMDFPEAADLRIPCFYTKASTDTLFGETEDDREKLTPAELSRDFSLGEIGTNDLILPVPGTNNFKEQDVREHDASIKVRNNRRTAETIANWFVNASEESKHHEVTDILINGIENYKTNSQRIGDLLGHHDMKTFAERVTPELNDALINPALLRNQVNDFVKRKLSENRRERFDKLLSTTQLQARPELRLPKRNHIINEPETSILKSLYAAEDGAMNNAERAMVQQLGSCENVRWWHRIRERDANDCSINGFKQPLP